MELKDAITSNKMIPKYFRVPMFRLENGNKTKGKREFLLMEELLLLSEACHTSGELSAAAGKTSNMNMFCPSFFCMCVFFFFLHPLVFFCLL